MNYEAMNQRQQAEQARQGRLEARARREARYDLRQGNAITPRDADDLRRAQPTKSEYWKYYGAELRFQRTKAQA